MTSSQNIAVSIVIPVLNNAARLNQCLQAVLAECAGRNNIEIIVVDNGSWDKSIVVAQSYGVRVLNDVRMASPFSARNTGIKASLGDTIVLLDSNCIPEKGWLRAGLAYLQKGFTMVSGRLVFEPIASRQYSAKFDALYAVIPSASDAKIAALPGGNLFIRQSTFHQHRMFISSLRGLGDIEWTQRVAHGGGKLGLAEKALVRYPAKSGWAFAKKMFRLGRGHKEWTVYKEGSLLRLPYFLRVVKQMLPPSPKFVRRMYRLGQQEGLAIPLPMVFILCYYTKLLRGCGMVFGAVHPDLYRGTAPEKL